MPPKPSQNKGAVRRHHPGSENLRPFAPGPNPLRNAGGVPPEVREVKAALALHGMELVKRLMMLARKGNVVAIKTGLEYVLGKPTQSVEVSGKDGGPIRVVDPRKLTDDQLDALDQILAASAGADDAPDAGGNPGGEGPAPTR